MVNTQYFLSLEHASNSPLKSARCAHHSRAFDPENLVERAQVLRIIEIIANIIIKNVENFLDKL